MNRTKKEKTLSLIALLSLALILLPLFAACGGGDKPAVTDKAPETTAADAAGETTAEETEPARKAPELPDADYDGYDFRVLAMFSTTMGGWTQPGAHYWSDFGYNEERAGEPINDTVHARNMAIEEKYNVTIHLTEVSSVKTEAQKFIAAGDDTYDIITPIINDSFSMAQSGYLIDMYTIPYIDMTEPWWDDILCEKFGMGGHIYVATGDISMEDEEYNCVTLFNKGMIGKFNLDDPYEAVHNGTLTLDFMYESGKKVTFDVDGDGVMTNTDSFGFGNDYTGGESFLFAAGESIARLNADGVPEITILNERAVNVMEKLIAQFNDPNYMIWASVIKEKFGISANWNELNNMLFDGRLLYRPANIYNIKQYREMIDDFGMLPSPKYDEKQKDYKSSISSHAATAISVPATNTDLERTGILLESLAYASDAVRAAYYEVTLTGKYARDAESIEILDVIFAARSYDIGKAFGWGNFTNIIYDSVKNNGGFVSSVEAAMPAAQAAMEKSYTTFMENIGQ